MGKADENTGAFLRRGGFLALLPLLFFLLGCLFVVFHFDLKPTVGDEGVLAMDAWRITQGQVPQRDFFEIIPPIAAYAQAAVFYLIGPSVLSLRLLGALYGVALLALAWIVARRYVKEPLNVALVLAMLVPFGVGVWPFASHHWLADIFILAALLVLDRAFNTQLPSNQYIFTTKARRTQREERIEKEADIRQATREHSFLDGGHGEETNLTTEAQRAQREGRGEKEADIRQATRQHSFLDGGHGEETNLTTEARRTQREERIEKEADIRQATREHSFLDGGHGEETNLTTEAQRLRGGVLAALGGALLALAALTLQDQGGYAIIGVLIATLAIPKEARLRVLAGLLAGIGTVALAVVAPLGLMAGPMVLLRDWFLFPLAHYNGAGGNQVTLASGFAQILSQWDPEAFRVAPVYATTIALASMFVYLLPFLCLGALLVAWRRKWLPPHSLALLAALCLSFLLCAWHRWSLMNLIWAAPLPMIAFSVALERAAASPKKWLALLSKGFAVTLLACLATFGVLRIKAASEKRRLHDIVTPAGSYRTFSPVEASELQGLVDSITENVPANAPLFCYGFNPLMNFLTEHPNPTRYNFIVPGGYATRPQIEEWETALLSPNVAWGYGPNLPSEPPEPLETFLSAHYEPVWNNSAYTLWRRRANVP